MDMYIIKRKNFQDEMFFSMLRRDSGGFAREKVCRNCVDKQAGKKLG